MRKWENLPIEMQSDELKEYYIKLKRRHISRFLKRSFDLIVSLLAILVLSVFFIIIGIIIKCSSRGPVFYLQSRVTRYNKDFKIIKFRTMIVDADKGSLVTVKNDSRITKIGKVLRKTKVDELPQLFNVFLGQMSFVGTRPEVRKYVNCYTNEMFATLLQPAGITSTASIKYKDEASIIDCDKIDEIYTTKVLPEKMKYNLEDIKKFSFPREVLIIIKTVFAIF